IGDPAPSLKLPDLNGRIVDLEKFSQKETVVLFWNPGCGFCQRMLPELKEWEHRVAPGGPQLLLISTGTVEANRAMGLRCHVLLDQSFASGRTFHVGGTPSAVLVDAEGKIASEVVSGAPAVMSLANSYSSQTAANVGVIDFKMASSQRPVTVQ
ncbi:MAG TPA: TlpA disulfide reductase family protein, partial [Terracidiphilus sp.]|nr:TlpA disulfide reductase family protein [Terracidiphilus sp.]